MQESILDKYLTELKKLEQTSFRIQLMKYLDTIKQVINVFRIN